MSYASSRVEKVQDEEEEDTPLILGRSMNIKADLIKIADIFL